MKFKVGDKVKILPSATAIGVEETEVGKIVKIRTIYSSNYILIGDSRGRKYGCWSVDESNIAPAIVKG